MFYITPYARHKTNTRRARSRKAKKQSPIRFSWLLAGIIIGAIITSLTALNLGDVTDNIANATSNYGKHLKQKYGNHSILASKKSDTVQKPKFEFYRKLTSKTSKEATNKAQTTGKNNHKNHLKDRNSSPDIYTIQAGSFSKENDA